MTEEKVTFCKKVINLEEQTVTWTFGNGAVRSISLDDLNEATQTHAALHGLSQKGGDSYASAGGDYAFAVAALDTTLGNLRAGVFNNVRTGDGQPKGVGELAAALVLAAGISMEEATALLANADEATVKAIRTNGEVKVAIADIRAEKARAKAAAAVAASGGNTLADTLKALAG